MRANKPVTPQSAATLPLAVGAALTLAVLVWAVWRIPPRPEHLIEELAQTTSEEALARTVGISNPVTAVLLDFRAYDTLLELAVLFLAVLALRATGAAAQPTAPDRNWRENRLLAAAVATVVPVALIVAAEPGGAFQAGAVLGGAGTLLVLAGAMDRHDFWGERDGLYRLGVVAGVGVFLLMGLALLASGRHFLQYPPGWAKALILVIETAAMASVATVFLLLFGAVASNLGHNACRGGQN